VAWEQLLSILKKDAADREFWAGQPPRACPHDGTPLLQAPPSAAGVELYCPGGDFRYPEDWDVTTMAGL